MKTKEKRQLTFDDIRIVHKNRLYKIEREHGEYLMLTDNLGSMAGLKKDYCRKNYIVLKDSAI